MFVRAGIISLSYFSSQAGNWLIQKIEKFFVAKFRDDVTFTARNVSASEADELNQEFGE